MELIFFYVNQSRTKFIEKQGFNFSSRYKFSVEYDKGTYILKGFECENPLPQNFFDETGCITNVTAVVGENGSGKTTLLTKLLGYSGQVKDKDHAPEYDAFFAEEYEIDKAISIYWDGNDLVCYHNIDEFENDTELLKENRVFYLTQGSDLLANMIANDKGFFDISKICVSNSIYGSNSEFVSMGNLEQLSLNMNSMQGLGNRFFRRKIRTNNRIVGEYFEVQDIMANEKEMADFQFIFFHPLRNFFQTPAFFLKFQCLIIKQAFSHACAKCIDHNNLSLRIFFTQFLCSYTHTVICTTKS